MACTASMKHAVVMVHKFTDTDKESPSCRRNVIQQEIAVQDTVHGNEKISTYPPADTKVEVPDELDEITLKSEPIDWQEDHKTDSLRNFKTEGMLRTGSSGACSASAVLQRYAGATQGNADSLPSNVLHLSNDVEARLFEEFLPQTFLCAHCNFSTFQRNSIELHLYAEHESEINPMVDLSNSGNHPDTTDTNTSCEMDSSMVEEEHMNEHQAPQGPVMENATTSVIHAPDEDGDNFALGLKTSAVDHTDSLRTNEPDSTAHVLIALDAESKRARRKCPYCPRFVVALPRHMRRLHKMSQAESRYITKKHNLESRCIKEKRKSCPIEGCYAVITRVKQHLRRAHKMNFGESQDESPGRSNSPTLRGVKEEMAVIEGIAVAPEAAKAPLKVGAYSESSSLLQEHVDFSEVLGILEWV